MRIIKRSYFFPLAVWPLLLLPAIGASQVQSPGDELLRDWLETQTNRDRQVTQDWWRCLDARKLNAYIEAGADINITDRRGWTPLHSAARFGSDPEVLVALLQAGAFVNAKDRSGDTALHWAAAENTSVAFVTLLIEAGADVNAVDKFGWLPIHTAAERSSNPEVVDALMSAGANRHRRAYFVLFSPVFLLKHNSNMSEADKEIAMGLLRNSKLSY